MSSRVFVFGVLLTCAASEQKPIRAEPGQTITLTCRPLNNEVPIIVVEWSRSDLETEYVLFYRDTHLEPHQQHPSYKNRVDLQDRQIKDGDVSLVLKNVTTADGGTYECRIVQRPRTRRKRAVLDGEPICVFNLDVVLPGNMEGDGEVRGCEATWSEHGGSEHGGCEDGGCEDRRSKDGGCEDGNSHELYGLLAALAVLGFGLKRCRKKESNRPVSPEEKCVEPVD